MLRLFLFFVSIISSYLLLRGWPIGWPLTLRLGLSSLVIIGTIFLWARNTNSSSTNTYKGRQPRAIDILTVILAFAIAECLLILVLAVTPPIAEQSARDLESLTKRKATAPNDPRENEAPKKAQPPSTQTSGNQLTMANAHLTPPRSGTLIQSNKPEVYLYPSSAKDLEQLSKNQVYLRAATFTDYSKSRWTNPPTPPLRSHFTIDGKVLSKQKNHSPLISYEVSHMSSIQNMIYIPNWVSLETLSGKNTVLTELRPDTFQLKSNLRRGKNYRYKLSSTPVIFENSKHQNVSPGETTNLLLLQLPPNGPLRAQIQNIATSFGATGSPALEALNNFFTSNFQYSLKTDTPPEVDTIEHFLTQSRTGSCTHFASATVMLARALGFPARVASGWHGGRLYSSPRNFILFRGRDSHAWAEIYTHEYGWIIFDTVPSAALSRNNTAQIPPPSSTDDFDQMFTEPLPTEEPTTSLANKAVLPTLTAAAFCLVTFLTLLIFGRKTTNENRESSTLITNHESKDYLQAFRNACNDHGHPIPAGRTMRAHLATFSPPDLLLELHAYHYAVTYGHTKRCKTTENQFIQQLKKWRKIAPNNENSSAKDKRP